MPVMTQSFSRLPTVSGELTVHTGLLLAYLDTVTYMHTSAVCRIFGLMS